MNLVLWIALGVGGATVLGALFGLFLKGVSEKISSFLTAFGAGVMLAAAIFALIIPAMEDGTEVSLYSVVLTVFGIFSGAILLDFAERLTLYLGRRTGRLNATAASQAERHTSLLFVLAIALHNLPEGIAAGVGFGTGNIYDALFIAGAIALQNIPEGMIIISPMLSSGISPLRALFWASLTGLVEVVGTFFGFWGVKFAAKILPFSLSFAGGTMIYVLCAEMIPALRDEHEGRRAIYALIGGFCLTIAFDALL